MYKFEPKRLIVARTARGLNQNELGEKILITGKQVSQIELGNRLPRLDQFVRICNVLKVTPDFLLGLSSYSELDKEIEEDKKWLGGKGK